MRFATLISETRLKFCLLFLRELQLNNTTSHIRLNNTFRHNLKEASILVTRSVTTATARPAPIGSRATGESFIGNGQTGVTYCTLVRKGEVISA